MTLQHTQDEQPTAPSPFDAIKQVRADGTEFWSARDLQPLLGYVQWKNFEVPLERARQSAVNQGVDVTSNFSDSRKVSNSGPAQKDIHLSRFAAYLVAMNGNPNKSEVAAAQAYFAVQTRFAEKVQERVADAAPVSAISVQELGVLFLETKSEFQRVITAETSNSPTAQNLSASMLEWTKMMSTLFGVTPAAPKGNLRLVSSSASPKPSVTAPSAPAEMGPFVSESGKVKKLYRPAPIPVPADVNDPMTYAQLCEREGTRRCGDCGRALSIYARNRANALGIADAVRGRNTQKNNIFPYTFWQACYLEYEPRLDALHARGHRK